MQTVAIELKAKVDRLESALLALTSIDDINQEGLQQVGTEFNFEHTAHLLHYVVEPIMEQVEFLRVQIHQLVDGLGEPQPAGA